MRIRSSQLYFMERAVLCTLHILAFDNLTKNQEFVLLSGYLSVTLVLLMPRNTKSSGAKLWLFSTGNMKSRLSWCVCWKKSWAAFCFASYHFLTSSSVAPYWRPGVLLKRILSRRSDHRDTLSNHAVVFRVVYTYFASGNLDTSSVSISCWGQIHLDIFSALETQWQ